MVFIRFGMMSRLFVLIFGIGNECLSFTRPEKSMFDPTLQNTAQIICLFTCAPKHGSFSDLFR